MGAQVIFGSRRFGCECANSVCFPKARVDQVRMVFGIFDCLLPSLNGCFAFAVGSGIGAFNSEALRPCLRDTFTLSRQKAGPIAKQLSRDLGPIANQAVEAARPYADQARQKMFP